VLRLAGFFALVFAVLVVLRQVPFVGAVFRIPFLGFWGAALLVSGGLAWVAERGLRGRRMRAQIRSLGAVDTPHNQGKLGSLLLAGGRARAAVEPLRRAAQGDPEIAEWWYRLGTALLAAGRPAEAVEPLERALALEEEHAYGQVLLRLAEAQLARGDAEASLAALERFERNHGPGPEWAYRRGRALARLRRRAEARASFRRAGELASQAVGFQKQGARAWAFKAFLASIV
jgi:tetratricopeptide (TPR) repeat protein